MRLPDPALVVLVGASGSGKSTWASDRYRAQEVVSSDELRGVVGSGPHDLDASADAFAVLETVVAARLGRGLTTVVDTLGLDAERRRAWVSAARSAGLPAVAVVLSTPAAECRRRNAARERPVPAPALAAQLARVARVRTELDLEGWDLVVDLEPSAPETVAPPSPDRERATERRSSTGVEIVLQVSRFPWGEEPREWLVGIARAADEAGFAGLAVMDHLIQIPQVGRAWEPIPEPWVTLGALAGLGTGLRLGTLCTPVTFRSAGITAKAAATLSALTDGRAFVGIGAGWWEREHLAHGLAFPPARERLDALESAIVTMRALWAPGTKADPLSGLPETTSYPRPPAPVPVVVGGSGERRTLRIAAALGDACNLPAGDDGRAGAQDRGAPAALRDGGARPRRGGGDGARPAGHRPGPGRRLGPGRAAPRPDPGGCLRRAPARRHRRRAPGAARRPGRARGRHRVPRDSRPGGARRRARPGRSQRVTPARFGHQPQRIGAEICGW